jgi:hypothetical protein
MWPQRRPLPCISSDLAGPAKQLPRLCRERVLHHEYPDDYQKPDHAQEYQRTQRGIRSQKAAFCLFLK